MPPVFVTEIRDNEGNVLANESDLTNKRKGETALSEEAADKMIYMLRSVVDGGTGSRLRHKYGIQAPLGGTTGTTNDNSDGWFMAVAPKLITGCWVGGDDRDIHFESMTYAQGASAALPIFAHYIKSVYADPDLDYRDTDQFDLPTSFNPCYVEGVDELLDEEEREDDDESHSGFHFDVLEE